MIIKSILDTDLYCFSCSYALMKNYPESEGTWSFIDRGGVKFSREFVNELKIELASLSSLKLKEEEFEWVCNKIKYIPKFYWQWLKGFRFNPNYFIINYNEETGDLKVDFEGPLTELALYDVPFLSIMSELWQRHNNYSLKFTDFISEVIDPDIELSNKKQLYFSEFGTRRRYSFYLQEEVVKRFKGKALYFNGTSNVYLAMKYELTPIGTMSHMIRQVSNAFFGYRMGEYQANEAWINAFDGNLGIALTDTISSKVFFKNLSRKHALLMSGFRQDSGSEYEYIEIFSTRYKQLGLDPCTKDLVFSNALTMETYEPIAAAAVGRCRRCSAGIGGHFVNRDEFRPKFVAKLTRCRITPREEWINTIKLSDDPGKAMGDKKEIHIAKLTCGLEEEKEENNASTIIPEELEKHLEAIIDKKINILRTILRYEK